jgi:hypothetical protein
VFSRATATLLIAGMLLAATAAGGSATAPPADKSKLLLTDGAPSIDDLLQRFLDALAKNDWQAMRKLRVTEYEYRYIIMPGAVPDGQPQRTYPTDVSEYFWDTLNTKSAYSEDHLLKSFGGHTYKLKDVTFAKGTRKYATYSGFAQARLRVEDGDGKQEELAIGSIAEVDGQYKFISFIRD